MSTGVQECWSEYRSARDGRNQRNRDESHNFPVSHYFPVRRSKFWTEPSISAGKKRLGQNDQTHDLGRIQANRETAEVQLPPDPYHSRGERPLVPAHRHFEAKQKDDDDGSPKRNPCHQMSSTYIRPEWRTRTRRLSNRQPEQKSSHVRPAKLETRASKLRVRHRKRRPRCLKHSRPRSEGLVSKAPGRPIDRESQKSSVAIPVPTRSSMRSCSPCLFSYYPSDRR